MSEEMSHGSTSSEAVSASATPQAQASATGGAGGAGGQAITLSYTDNYSSLMLVYTFLLNLANGPSMNEGTRTEMNLLLPMLQSAMEEEKKYREAFLSAVQSLVAQNVKSE
jgi:hypothetical protein